jgi:hypothetical protein
MSRTSQSPKPTEVNELRNKLLMWAAPISGSGLFEPAAIARIKDGSGYKDTASDLVALVGLYRAKWDAVKSICGVTEDDLKRAAEIGPAVFAFISRREFQTTTAMTDGSPRVRRAWTLLDRAYSHCRRALQYLRFNEGDADTLAPSLRRNQGPSGKPTNDAPPAPAPASPQPIEARAASSNGGAVQPGAALGGGAGPFAAKL